MTSAFSWQKSTSLCRASFHIPRPNFTKYSSLCYTVEVTNRFKGLDLIDRVPEELWMEVHDIVQEAVIKTLSKSMRKKGNPLTLLVGTQTSTATMENSVEIP